MNTRQRITVVTLVVVAVAIAMTLTAGSTTKPAVRAEDQRLARRRDDVVPGRRPMFRGRERMHGARPSSAIPSPQFRRPAHTK
jgi:hypothetical protein